MKAVSIFLLACHWNMTKKSYGWTKFVKSILMLVQELHSSKLTHYQNLVVNEEPRPGELKVFLLDYELSSYGPRGFDLGAHFFNREFDYDNYETSLSGEEMHTEEERRQFLKHYQDELRRLNVKDFDDQGLDSIENLLFESYVGALLYHVYFTYLAVNLWGEEGARQYPSAPLFINTFSSIYIKCKKLAIEKYPFLDPLVLMWLKIIKIT